MQDTVKIQSQMLDKASSCHTADVVPVSYFIL
jgi:hypothetical protein